MKHNQKNEAYWKSHMPFRWQKVWVFVNHCGNIITDNSHQEKNARDNGHIDELHLFPHSVRSILNDVKPHGAWINRYHFAEIRTPMMSMAGLKNNPINVQVSKKR